MRFFVPTANDRAQAEAMYDRIRARVSSRGGPVDRERIFRIRFNRDGKGRTLAVGDSYRELGEDPVFAIFKAPSHYVVCTFNHGGQQGEPVRIEQEAVSAVEQFES